MCPEQTPDSGKPTFHAVATARERYPCERLSSIIGIWEKSRLFFLYFSSNVFLRLNGYKITVDPRIVYEFQIGLFASNICDLEHLEPWLSSIIVKARGLEE